MARKAKNIHYIYKTTCNVTGRWYIGMHSCYDVNDGYMGSGTVLRHSIRKYGADKHTKEILEYCKTREELVLREIEIVTKELISDGKCMNLKEGGQGGFRDEEHMVKCSKAGGKAKTLKMDNDENFKNSVIEILKNGRDKYNSSPNRHKSFEGKSHSEESKQLISEQRKGTGTGETNSQFGTCWITKDGLNKKIKKEEITTWLEEGWIKGRKNGNS